MKKVVLVGSSRSDGNTMSLVKNLTSKVDWDVLNLSDYNFSYFDYEHKNRDDDYLDLMRLITKEYETLIIATPVYWYAMSGIMKVFFDRLTDLLTIEKELGRKLKGKEMAVISSSTGGNLGACFWQPFQESARYLGMEYIGNIHTVVGESNELELTAFIKTIER